MYLFLWFDSCLVFWSLTVNLLFNLCLLFLLPLALDHNCVNETSCLSLFNHTICVHGRCMCDAGYVAQSDNTVCIPFLLMCTICALIPFYLFRPAFHTYILAINVSILNNALIIYFLEDYAQMERARAMWIMPRLDFRPIMTQLIYARIEKVSPEMLYLVCRFN